MAEGEAQWQLGEASDRGRVRSVNEDRVGHLARDWGQAYIVADGMGGHKAGRLASKLTVNGILTRLDEKMPVLPVTQAIREAFEETNALVHEKATSGDPDTKGLGSTAVLLTISGAGVHLAHVGDSRAYLYRGGKLEPLTKDHSVVQRMVDAGMLSAAEAREHPDASVIYRAVGDKPEVEVEIRTDFPVRPGDGFLLCSDGLCGYVEDGAIEAALRSCSGDVQERAERLLNLALEAGGKDNISVQFLQYGEPPPAATPKAPCCGGVKSAISSLASALAWPFRRKKGGSAGPGARGTDRV